MKRLLIIGTATIITTGVVTSVLLWVVLSAWVPTHGKTLLIETLERRAPIRVSIDRMRYELVRGVVADRVQIVDRTSGQPWLSAPSMWLQVGWVSLLLQGRVVVHAQAALEAPCPTEVALIGSYHLRTKMLTIDVRTSECLLPRVTGPLAARIPPALTNGSVRLTLHVTHQPNAPPLAIAVRIDAANLTWQSPTMRWQADATINGNATSSTALRVASRSESRDATAPWVPGEPWQFQARIGVRNGAIDGLPMVHAARDLSATAHLSNDRLEIDRLQATVLGSRWTLEGALAPLAHPAFEALLSARVDVAQLAAVWTPAIAGWQLSGASDVRAVCRGSLESKATPDCLIHAHLERATLAGAKLSQPITDIAADMAYDVLTHRLAAQSLTAHVLGQSLSVRGEATLATPVRLSLGVTGTLPLEAANDWLPATSLLRDLGGVALVDLHLDGPQTRLTYTGTANVRDAHATLLKRRYIIEQCSGPIAFTKDTVEGRQLSFQLNGQPATLSATLTLGARPQLTATLAMDQNRLALAGRLDPERFQIDEATMALPHSELHLTGTYGRTPEQPSALRLKGAVELSDLAHVPLVPLPALEPWNLRGVATLDARLEGRLNDWPSATLRGVVQAAHVSVRDIPLEQFSCELDQANRTARLRIPSAQLADGKLWAELAVEHHNISRDYLLQADLVGVQLARLADAIPAWRQRAVSGTASAHAMLSGTWETRPTWRGEGWLNASGEGLADLPLLDKIFRGLFGVLADRMGLEALRRAQITQASVRWRLAQERLRTEDLRLGGVAGTEPVAIYANGSVGFDQTLDFTIEPELSEGVVLNAPTTSTIASAILKAAGQLERLRRLIGRHRLTGTLKQPEYHFELSSQEVFKQLGPGPVDLLHTLLDAVR